MHSGSLSEMSDIDQNGNRGNRHHRGDLRPPLRAELISPRGPSLPAERLCSFVLARIAHALLDLAGQNPGDADRVGDDIGGSFLALRAFRHGGTESCFTQSLPANSLAGLKVHQPKKVGREL